ncbi:MAG TPA: ABC transporter permease [Thermoanaerobaculia bacterium]|nr:ABC transporter permease [Thermoanaerobaculia bacterium]
MAPPVPTEASSPDSRRARPARSLVRAILPISGIAVLVVLWDVALRLPGSSSLLPRPFAVVRAIGELAQKGFLVKHVVASLFRVTWGYVGAVLVGVPLGIVLGWYRRGGMAIAPLLEVLRPISPLAWIPIAILWFGVGDVSAVFIIFLGALFPITLTAMNAVRGVDLVHVNAGRNFGLRAPELLRRVIYPAILPQLLVGLRLSLGIAWLVVVAAEMIAVSSGLGFLIIDARNAGNRYDLVVAGMVLIGVIGIALDALIRGLERSKALAWGYTAIEDAANP